VHWTKPLQWPWKYFWAQYQYQSITQKKTVWKWSSVKEVSLRILPTEKLYNLCTRRWFLTASVQAYYDRRRRRRRRRCLNRVAKLEWSSLILVLASRNVWHKRTTQTFWWIFLQFFSIGRSITRVVPKTSGWLSLSGFGTFLEDFMAVAISVIPTHLCWKQLVILTSGTGYHSLILNSSTHETS
jgi:hypothetical protein